MKKILLVTAVCAAVGAMVGCGSGKIGTDPKASSAEVDSKASEALAGTMVLKLGTCAPESSTFVSNAQIMAEKLKELSGNTMDIAIVSGGALGNIPQHFAQMNDGKLDLFVQGVDAPAAVEGGEDFNILNTPFLFDDTEHFHKFLNSEIFDSMMERVREKNKFSFLGLLGDRPPRSLSTKNRAVREPADMGGLVLRVPESAIPMEVFRAWGANTTTSAASAIFEGLQSGQFDGQDNGIEAMVIDGFMEVQDYYMAFDHTQQGIGAFIADSAAEKLTEQQRGWLEESLEYAYEVSSTELWEKDVPGYYEAMEEKGTNIVKDVNTDAFREIVTGLIPKFEGNYFSEGLYDQVRELAE